MSERTVQHVIPKNHLWKASFLYESHSLSCYNYERMMGTAFAHALRAIIYDLYKDDPDADAKRHAVMKRNLEFYNTEPEFGGLIFGAVCALEEQKSLGEDIPDELISSVKTSLMGPLAGIGDTIVQAVWNPIILAICIDITLQGSLLGVFLHYILTFTRVYAMQFGFFWLTYNKGSEAIFDLLQNGVFDKILDGAKVMGCFVMGGLIANFVKLSTGLTVVTQNATFSIQEKLFDAVFPKILPLCATMLVYWLISKKKVKTTTILLIIVAVGIVGGLTGIFK